tara:strand:- start:4432 stop:6387 length:1956 start_codon:yes stop_codon:yes gene_type:complete
MPQQNTLEDISVSNFKKVKFSFPYTFIFYNAEQALSPQGNPMFDQWLMKEKGKCDCKGDELNSNYGNGGDKCDDSEPQAIQSEKSAYIIVIKYEALEEWRRSNMVGDWKWFNKSDGSGLDKSKINNILGFCTVMDTGLSGSGKQTLSIFDVCLTLNKAGMGKTLFSVIIIAIEMTFSYMNPILWLGVRLSNPNYEKVCNIYTSFGFTEPHITCLLPNKTRPETKNNMPFLSLSRTIYSYSQDENLVKNCFEQCLYLRNNFLKRCVGGKAGELKTASQQKEIVNKIKINLNKSSLYYLRSLCFMGIADNSLSQSFGKYNDSSGNLVGKTIEKEFGGRFDIIKSELINKKDYEIELGFVSNGAGFELSVGNDATIPRGPPPNGILMNSYFWHTHPWTLYNESEHGIPDVMIGCPSGADCNLFLQGLLANQKSVNPAWDNVNLESPPFAHYIVAVEGIYCISFHDDIIPHMNDLVQSIISAGPEAVSSHWVSVTEYPKENRFYEWNNHFTTEGVGDDKAVKECIDKYLNWFNNDVGKTKNVGMTADGHQVLKVQFKNWKELYNGDKFEIPIYTLLGNSFIDTSKTSIFRDTYAFGKENLAIPEAFNQVFEGCGRIKSGLKTSKKSKLFFKYKKPKKKKTKKKKKKSSKKKTRKR